MFLFFKQKTAYEMLISDWSSDVCSSDLPWPPAADGATPELALDLLQLAQQFGRAEVRFHQRRGIREIPPRRAERARTMDAGKTLQLHALFRHRTDGGANNRIRPAVADMAAVGPKREIGRAHV